MGLPAPAVQPQDSVLKEPWQTAADAFKNWQKLLEKTRDQREKAARTAVANCFKFAETAFANPEEFETLKKELQITSKSALSPYFDAVKVCFGGFVVEHETNTTSWMPLSDQQAHKYVKIMDYASFRGVAAAEMEGWLNKDDRGERKSLSKRYQEAVNSTDYKEHCKSLGYSVRDEAAPTVVRISPEQQALLDEYVLQETDLEPGSFTPGFTLQIRHVDPTGRSRTIELPSGIVGMTDVKAIQRLIDKATETDPAAKGFERLMAMLRLAALIKLRKNDIRGRVIELSNTTQGMTVRIGHNNTKGSIQIHLAYATPDRDLPALNTVLTEDFIRWVPALYSAFGGHWQAADHECQPAISIMPPSHLSVEGRFAAINKKRKEAAESAAEKKAAKSGHKYTSGGAKFTTLYQPRFTLTANEGARLIVPLTGLLKKDQKVRFACLRENVEFSPVVVTLRPRDVEDIVSKEDEVIAKKVDDPSGGGKKVPRIQGDLYNFRITNQRISFCDIDGTVVGHCELPNRIGDEEFRKDYILTKKTLRTVLKELTTMMPNMPVQLEFSDTVLRISAKSGGTHGMVLLPAALTAYSGNTTAFWFEKTE